MDDLISRKALLETPWVLPDTMTRKQALECFVNILSEAPAVDAVPVVRCRECRHWGTGHCAETDAIKVCEYADYMIGCNGYCVYGERREDDAQAD